MAFADKIEASLAGQALAQRGVDIMEKIKVHEYTQTRGGKMVHVSGYDRAELIKMVESLKAGHSITFPDGQQAKLSADGQHLDVVDQHGRTSNFYKHGEHLHGGADVADHIRNRSAQSTHPDSLGGKTAHRDARSADTEAILNKPEVKPKSMTDDQLKSTHEAHARQHEATNFHGTPSRYQRKMEREMKRRGMDPRRRTTQTLAAVHGNPVQHRH